MGRPQPAVVVRVFGLAALALAASTPAPAEPPPEALLGARPMLEGVSPAHVVIDLAPEGRGRPLPMMIDTGGSASVVTGGLARSLGISVRRLKSTPYRRATFLGRDLQFRIYAPSSDTERGRGIEAGIVGSDFLDDYVVEIDYPDRTVRFYDPDRYAVPESAAAPDEAVIPFERNGTRILVDFELEGRRLQGLLDTGGGVPAVLSGRLASRAGIDWRALPEAPDLWTLRGPMEVRLLESERLRFAGFDLPRMAALVAPRGWLNAAGPTDSVIGHDVLSRFTLRIDYPRQRLWLRHHPDTPVTFAGRPYTLSRRRSLGAVVLEEELESAREAAREADRAREAAWRERRDERLYVEGPGGWRVVEAWRRRLGPEPGEVWVTWEELQRIRGGEGEGAAEAP